MDNRVFNVNGSGDEMLLQVLKIAFMQAGRNTYAKAWLQTEEHGLVLCWVDSENLNTLPGAMTAEECMPMVKGWLSGEFAKSVKPAEWCEDVDHDGNNPDGWQVYVEGWGKVGPADYRAICGVRPAFMWHGK